jgi:hypothetical protein
MNGIFDRLKPWWASLGVWGALGTIVVGVLDAIHLKHSPALSDDMNSWSAAAGVVITGLMALWGRLRAKSRIGSPTTGAPTVSSLLLVIGTISLLALSGCNLLKAPNGAYVAADRATYESVGAEWITYVHNDPDLSQSDKDLRDRKLLTWQKRIEQAESETKVKTRPEAANPSSSGPGP